MTASGPRTRPAADLVVQRCRQLITCPGPAPRSGPRQTSIDVVHDGAIASSAGRLVFAGATADLESSVDLVPGARVLDATGLSIVPGFVDAHTHAVFAGDRRDELRRRLSGETYSQIAAAGGGIVATVRATRNASEDDLVTATRARLDEMLACGTTTCEVKSGYGLAVEPELKMLRAVRRLNAAHDIDLVATFLGAHEIPLEYRGRRQDYVDLVVKEMIPAVASDGLAEWCDVFCEEGVFTPEESLA
ncbi:MAG TPA: hypothetical protein VLD67_07675, partial [Vicinamibacterales bacterium]|nr:hypothetical protein [Vicinamibacterales bacterium]